MRCFLNCWGFGVWCMVYEVMWWMSLLVGFVCLMME